MTYTCILLPWPPSVNSLFGQAPGKQRYPSAAYRRWTTEAMMVLRKQGPQHHYDTPVSLKLSFGAPDKRVRDLSNFIKAPEDLIVKAEILKDDSLVYFLQASWAFDVENAVRVEIEEI